MPCKVTEIAINLDRNYTTGEVAELLEALQRCDRRARDIVLEEAGRHDPKIIAAKLKQHPFCVRNVYGAEIEPTLEHLFETMAVSITYLTKGESGKIVQQRVTIRYMKGDRWEIRENVTLRHDLQLTPEQRMAPPGVPALR